MASLLAFLCFPRGLQILVPSGRSSPASYHEVTLDLNNQYYKQFLDTYFIAPGQMSLQLLLDNQFEGQDAVVLWPHSERNLEKETRLTSDWIIERDGHPAGNFGSCCIFESHMLLGICEYSPLFGPMPPNKDIEKMMNHANRSRNIDIHHEYSLIYQLKWLNRIYFFKPDVRSPL